MVNYLKKQFYILPILFLTIISCSSSKQNTDQVAETSEQEIIVIEELTSSSNITGLQKITGNLNYSGSEPFVTPTIFISGNSSYKLMGDESFIKDIYPTINGENASLYGKIIEKGRLIYFQVHFYEIITD